jgi:hypothetical protein
MWTLPCAVPRSRRTGDNSRPGSTCRNHTCTQANFDEFLRTRPDAAAAVSRSVGAKLRWATQRRIDFSGYPVKTRVARVLLELAAVHSSRSLLRFIAECTRISSWVVTSIASLLTFWLCKTLASS